MQTNMVPLNFFSIVAPMPTARVDIAKLVRVDGHYKFMFAA